MQEISRQRRFSEEAVKRRELNLPPCMQPSQRLSLGSEWQKNHYLLYSDSSGLQEDGCSLGVAAREWAG